MGYQIALKGHEAALGFDHTSVLIDCSNLGGVFEDQKDFKAAEPLYRRALVGFKKSLGPTHGSTLVVTNNLALLLSKLEKNLEAEQLYREALAGLEKLHGWPHHQVLNAAVNLAALLAWHRDFNLQQRKEAADLYRRCREGFLNRFGPEDADTIDCEKCLKDLLMNIEKEENKMKEDEEKLKKEEVK